MDIIAASESPRKKRNTGNTARTFPGGCGIPGSSRRTSGGHPDLGHAWQSRRIRRGNRMKKTICCGHQNGDMLIP